MEPALKQRLVGAAVLIALAVIFLPMLIQGPRRKAAWPMSRSMHRVRRRANSKPATCRSWRPKARPPTARWGWTPRLRPPTPTPRTWRAPRPRRRHLPANGRPPHPLASAPISSAPLKDTAATTTQALPAESTAPAEMFPAPTAGGNYAVNFGSFSTTAAADKLIASLRNSQCPAIARRPPSTARPSSACASGPTRRVRRADLPA
jgi:DedD protein